MTTNMTVSRSERILASLKSYRSAVQNDAGLIGLTSVLEPAEKLIGVYANPPGAKITEIIVTTERLFIHFAVKPTEYVKYQEIKAATVGDDAVSSHMITVTRYDGTTCNIEVAGGEGRFRDSMAFIQFLDRVVADLRRCRVVGGNNFIRDEKHQLRR